jgi:hypothetical protein
MQIVWYRRERRRRSPGGLENCNHSNDLWFGGIRELWVVEERSLEVKVELLIEGAPITVMTICNSLIWSENQISNSIITQSRQSVETYSFQYTIMYWSVITETALRGWSSRWDLESRLPNKLQSSTCNRFVDYFHFWGNIRTTILHSSVDIFGYPHTLSM